MMKLLTNSLVTFVKNKNYKLTYSSKSDTSVSMTADNFLCKPNIIEFSILISSFFSANKWASINKKQLINNNEWNLIKVINYQFYLFFLEHCYC